MAYFLLDFQIKKENILKPWEYTVYCELKLKLHIFSFISIKMRVKKYTDSMLLLSHSIKS